MELSRTERWILSNQYRILEALYPGDASWFSTCREAIENGYELEYESACHEVHADVLSIEGCREVLDILDMFRAIKHGFERLPDKSWAEARQIFFPGFDGNNEGKQMAYARYLCNQDRFREQFRDLFGEEDAFNSHFPMLDRYRKMLTEWNASPDGHDLTQDDIQRIKNAGDLAPD